jgi:hypothetical protein
MKKKTRRPLLAKLIIDQAINLALNKVSFERTDKMAHSMVWGTTELSLGKIMTESELECL